MASAAGLVKRPFRSIPAEPLGCVEGVRLAKRKSRSARAPGRRAKAAKGVSRRRAARSVTRDGSRDDASVSSPGASGRAIARPVLAAFCLSGFAALMHQVVWAKLLVGLIGATAYAQACVLAVFMAGLAIGAVVFGRWVDRGWRAPAHVFRDRTGHRRLLPAASGSRVGRRSRVREPGRWLLRVAGERSSAPLWPGGPRAK